jgi:hypothetical protein
MYRYSICSPTLACSTVAHALSEGLSAPISGAHLLSFYEGFLAIRLLVSFHRLPLSMGRLSSAARNAHAEHMHDTPQITFIITDHG